MFKKIMILLSCGCFAGMLNAAEILNGSFENGFENWQVKGSALIDTTEGAFGKSSLKITLEKAVWQRVFQSFTVKPSTTYKLEYYVKCENIVPQPDARFAGAASWISMKKNTPLRGKQGPWKLDTAPGGWQLVSYTFKTGPEDTTAAVEFQLRNASGTVWFDGVKITEISDTSAK